jgi:hypothetical protein
MFLGARQVTHFAPPAKCGNENGVNEAKKKVHFNGFLMLT